MTMFLILLLIPTCVFSLVYHDVEREIDEAIDRRHIVGKGTHLNKHKLNMPNVVPAETDTYLCVGYELPEDDRYIVSYTPAAKMQIAHHMLMYACREPHKREGHWNCREEPVCESGPETIVYAWAKDAPPLILPNDVGFHVGGKTGYRHLVLQVHYLNVSSFQDGKTTDRSGVQFTLDDRKKSKLSGIYLLANGYKRIPPHEKRVHVDFGCTYTDGPAFKPFRFRVHAHKLGVVITAYRVRNNKWTLIGRGDPQIPQAFYPSANITIEPGDAVMGRCTYDSTKRDRWTEFGATHMDEMCNFYIMYQFQPRDSDDVGPQACQYPSQELFQHFPKCSDVSIKEMKYSDCWNPSRKALVP